MAYTVSFTDFVNKGSITVDEGTLNTETTLGLPGRNFTDYGTTVLENFLHLLENFANNNSPTNPVEGQLWYDNTDGVDQLKIYTGSQWISAGGLKKATSAPDAALSTVGDVWVNTSSQQLYLYSGSGWILVGPEYSEGNITGAKFENVASTDNVNIPVIINYASGIPVSIISSTSFTPKSVISGFTTINAGVNVSNSYKYYGTSQKAEQLLVGGVPYSGAAFARLDGANVLTQLLKVSTNSGVLIGENLSLSLSVSGSTAEIRNTTSDGSIDFKVNNDGVANTALRIFNNTKVAIGSPTKIPTEALDVIGNIVSSGTITVNSTTNSSSIATGALVVKGGVGVAQDVTVGGGLTVIGTTTLSDNVFPDTNGTVSIGTNSLKFNNVYANTFYGSFVGSLAGSITGAAASAGKLSSPTTFALTGDVTASSFVFDGQVGGTTKTFTTTLSDSFFTGKPLATTIVSSDEVLINNAGTLKRITQTNLVSKIPNSAVGPITPVGMISMWAGSTAPAGWFLCDGGEYTISGYAALYAVTGSSFGTSSSPSLLFRVPDMRGRFPLGYLGAASSGTRVLNDPAANAIGNIGGDESALITTAQLPSHYHTLEGDNGTPFLATSGLTSVTDSATIATTAVGGNLGTGITRTGDIEGFSSQDEFTTVPPFATVNYIIFHGVF
jgi:microcystin-dependent protein